MHGCLSIARERAISFPHGVLYPFLPKDSMLEDGYPGVGALYFNDNCPVHALRGRLFCVRDIQWRVTARRRRVSRVLYRIATVPGDTLMSFEDSNRGYVLVMLSRSPY